MRIPDRLITFWLHLASNGTSTAIAAEARMAWPMLIDAHRCDQATIAEVWALLDLGGLTPGQQAERIAHARTLLRAALEDGT